MYLRELGLEVDISFKDRKGGSAAVGDGRKGKVDISDSDKLASRYNDVLSSVYQTRLCHRGQFRARGAEYDLQSWL